MLLESHGTIIGYMWFLRFIFVPCSCWHWSCWFYIVQVITLVFMLRNLNFSIIVFYWHFHHFHTFQQFTLILKLYWFIIKLVHIFVLHPLVFLIVCNHLNLLGFFIKLFKIPLWAFLYAKTFSNKIFWVNVYMEHILVYILLLII